MHGHVCVPCGLHECAEAGKGCVRNEAFGEEEQALAAARRGERGGDPVEPTERGLDARLCLSIGLTRLRLDEGNAGRHIEVTAQRRIARGRARLRNDVVLEEPPRHLCLRLGVGLERNRHRLVVPDAVGRVLRPSRALQLPDALEQRVAVLRQLPGPAEPARRQRDHDAVSWTEHTLDELRNRVTRPRRRELRDVHVIEHDEEPPAGRIRPLLVGRYAHSPLRRRWRRRQGDRVECGHLLTHAIFPNREVFRPKVLDRIAAAIEYDSVNRDEVDARGKGRLLRT